MDARRAPKRIFDTHSPDQRAEIRPTLLAPSIVSAILNGNQPPVLTARKLMDDTRLPLDWNEQWRALGFA